MSDIHVKDFDGRNCDKQKVDVRRQVHGKVGQIRNCKVGVNVGSEIDGKGGYLRPIIILAIMGNMIFVAHTTTQNRNLPYYVKIKSIDFGLDLHGRTINSFVVLSQCKMIDSKRLIKHKYTIDKQELSDIKKLLISFIQ